MFSKFIRKDTPPAATEPVSIPVPVVEVDWENRLKEALGNDTALLALANETPSVDIKLAAVEALTGEDALKQAEREFRTHDRRVHRAAKQRYEAQVRQREMRGRADELIAAATALAGETIIPANRLVEFDQAWRDLDASLLEDDQTSRFTSLQANLSELLRERGEHKRLFDRWCADAKAALAHLNASSAGVAAASIETHELAAATEQARSTLASVPATSSLTAADASAIVSLEQSLRTALQDASLIEERLALLDELQRGAPQQKTATEQEAGDTATTPAATPAQRWQALTPLADQRIGDTLNGRFEEWLRIKDEARSKRKADRQKRSGEKNKAAQQAHIQTLTEAAEATEAALAAGHLAEAEKHLATLQATHGNGGAGAALQARIDTLQSEIARLKGWQHWGGGRVRDDLVLEAEALALSVAGEGESLPAKLPLEPLAKTIEQLRTRWKELDRLGGATSKENWQRFDAALKTAYLPVAAHQTRLKEARRENLAARENLLAAIDAINIVVDDQGNAPDWKEIARALAHFQTEWRKLGPLKHTVPHKAQESLLARMKASVARLEEPLQETQRGAQTERQQFIERAKSLSQNAQERDMPGKIRELQAQWQQHARSQPLPRKVENALWAEFRAAIDTIMSQRKAAFSARNAEFEANQVTREALIIRLAELTEDTPPAEIKRVMATIDAEWRKAGEAPRNQAAKLESRFRAARDAARQYIAGSAQRIWHATCDALAAKLSLCDEVEAGTPTIIPEIESRWAALPQLPPSWEQALQARFKTGVELAGNGSVANCGAPANADETLDNLLLQLESALDIPSPEAFQAARRAFKLLAMKHAMEGSRPNSQDTADIEKMTAAAIGYARTNLGQRQRLAAIISAFHAAGPASLRIEAGGNSF